MLTIDRLSKTFDEAPVLDIVGFEVQSGSLCGLVGYNGAGKTTLMKIAADIYRADAGRVLLDGEDAVDNERVRQRLFFLPDELYRLPQATLKGMADFYSGYYPTWNEQTFQKLTEMFALNLRSRLQGFSKGMQRQAYLALALSCQPRCLLLDESFDGLDPSKRNLMRRILLEYIAEKDACVLISSHNLPELENLCDHVVLLGGGRVLMDKGLDELQAGMGKYRLVFDRDVKREDFPGLDIRQFSSSGRVITLSIQGEQERAEAALRAMNPVMLEAFPLTLAEIFISEMEEKEYDLTGLF